MTPAPSPLCVSIERLLLGIRSGSRERANELFKKLPGRGCFVPRLSKWLEQEPSPFGEPVQADDLDGIQDHGVDVLLEGVRSGTRVGFQVKSDRDLAAKDFSQRLKAQLSDAQDYEVELMVVVFACRPTDENLGKIKIFQSFMQRRSGLVVRCLSPERAAALHDLFDQPLPLIDTPERNWGEFFRAVGQSQLSGEYLDPWPGLPPDRRYLPPNEWGEIRKSLEKHRLTILVGPLASGKTFTALQLLWEAFQAGRPVFWITASDIEATDGPIPSPRSGWRELQKFKSRIDKVLRTLGPEPGREPVDEHDLVSRFLRPGAVVYIEDPFGKTDDEYALSLSSKENFDLQRLIDRFSDSSARADCRIVITSREHLFRNWLSDTRAKHQKTPEASILTLARSSYLPGPLFDHLVTLAQARELAEPEEIADLLTDEIEYPLEGDLLIRSLPAAAGAAEAQEALRGWQGDLRSKIEGRLTPEDAGEALVLLLIAAFASAAEGPIHPEEIYTKLHQALSLPGDPQEVFRRSMRKLEPFLASRRNPSGAESSRILVPHHSVIAEALREQLAATERRNLLRRVTLVLPDTAPTQIPPSRLFGGQLSGGPSWYAHAQIAAYLVSLGTAFEGEQEQAALEKVIFDLHGIGRYEHRFLMRLWPQLPMPLRERFFAKLRKPSKQGVVLLREAAAYLPWAPLPPEDAWRLLEMLFEDPQRGAAKTTTLGESPWTFLFLHLATAPENFLDRLDRWAHENPAFFVYALEEGLVMLWEVLPLRPDRLLLWRSCLLHPDCLKHEQVQGRLLMTIARNWDHVSHSLQDLFDSQSRNQNAQIRGNALSAALFYSGDHPDLERFASDALYDPDPRLAVRSLTWGRGEVQRRFAEGLFERATPGVAAEMTLALLRGHSEMTEWEKGALVRCERMGGDAVKAAIVYSIFEGTERAKQLAFEVQEVPPLEESEIVRAAWIWARLNGFQRKVDPLSDDDLMNLLRGLSDPQIRGYCIFYTSYRSKFLSEGVRAFLAELSETSEEDADAIRQGKTELQPPDGWDRSLHFLVFEMVSSA